MTPNSDMMMSHDGTPLDHAHLPTWRKLSSYARMAEKSAGEAMADRREDEEEEVSFKSLVNTFPASQYYVIPR